MRERQGRQPFAAVLSAKPRAFALAIMLAAACVPLASGAAVRRARWFALRASVMSRRAACFALRRWRAAPQTVRVPPRIRRVAALRRWRAAASHLLCPSGLASLAGVGGFAPFCFACRSACAGVALRRLRAAAAALVWRLCAACLPCEAHP